MSNTKKIGVLTSGGDCSGLNAIIRAVVNAATKKAGKSMAFSTALTAWTGNPRFNMKS